MTKLCWCKVNLSARWQNWTNVNLNARWQKCADVNLTWVQKIFHWILPTHPRFAVFRMKGRTMYAMPRQNSGESGEFSGRSSELRWGLHQHTFAILHLDLHWFSFVILHLNWLYISTVLSSWFNWNWKKVLFGITWAECNRESVCIAALLYQYCHKYPG
jgi:hypothetical protein